MPHAHIDADDGFRPVRAALSPLHFDGEAHIPAIGGAADGGRQNAGAALLQPPCELASGLVGPDYPDAWQLNVVAVGQDLERAGGEAAALPGAALPLGAWEAHELALAAASAGVGPVLQRPGKGIQPGGIGLLAVLPPPRRHLLLDLVPF